MVLVQAAGPEGIEVHQLLIGRDLAAGSDVMARMAAQMANYVYVLVAEESASRTAVIVDGCWDIEGLLELCKRELCVESFAAAVYTHHHFDHTGGKLPKAMTGGRHVELPGLAEFHKAGISVAVGAADLATVAKQSGLQAADIRALGEGDEIALGKACIRVLQTPGHTPGSVCFKLEAAGAAPVLFTGDTLFIGSCGRYHLPDSDLRAMLASLDRLSKLPEDTVVLPGHNYAAPAHTTIGAERHMNDMMIQAMGLVKSGRIAPSPVAASLLLPDYLAVARTLAEMAPSRQDGADMAEDCCAEVLPFFAPPPQPVPFSKLLRSKL